MSRKRVEPKTPLGKRLSEVREALKFDEREPFAEALGISVAMLGYYERGDRVPDAEVLALYRERFGVNISWVVTGIGTMFDDGPTEPLGYDIALLQRIGDKVEMIFIQVKQRAPVRSTIAEAGEIYNELLKTIPDVKDEKMVEAVLPVLLERFKERIATAQPGSGKREAS